MWANDYENWEEDSEDYPETELCVECDAAFDCYTACECGNEGGWIGDGSDYVREDFGFFGRDGLWD